MSYMAIVDTESVADIGTNWGWYDFAEWVRGLENVPALASLATHGLTDYMPEMRKELAGLLKTENLTESRRQVGEAILKAAEGREGVFLISGEGRAE